MKVICGSARPCTLAGRTVLPDPGRHATAILLMDDGRVVERGTHEQLMAAHGVHHGMVLRQMASAAQDETPVLR